MRAVRISVIFLTVVACLSFVPAIGTAESIKIAIMQDDKDASQRFTPLVTYLAKKGIMAHLVVASHYPAAARMFASGEVDAMFSGSGVAGSMIIMDLATPLVRPVAADGTSTYWAVVLGKKDTAKFDGACSFFSGKKVLFTALASSGEFFYYSLPDARKVKSTIVKAASHGAAIEILAKGGADVAIVKNRIWDKQKANYSSIAAVGEDNGENPDNTMIVGKKADQKTAAKVAAALLALKDDQSPEAGMVLNKMQIQGFKKTTTDDFKHTLAMLKKAGVDKSFSFAF
jgi:ABC-type phosphate/phosphonate transport system substrate-binding protein